MKYSELEPHYCLVYLIKNYMAAVSAVTYYIV